MGKAIVAKGRTISTLDGYFGPGQEVALPSAEIGRLRNLGYLVDPKAKEVARDNGPTFTAQEGSSTKVIG